MKIDIDHPQAAELVAYLKTLDFVNVEEGYNGSKAFETAANEPITAYNNTNQDYEIPEWHKEIVHKSIADYGENPDSGKSLAQVLQEIRKDL
ncbi:hypothetical protein N9J89_00640 [Bacteroidia bacterium]|nr:hypothetical protein [Bacteroidia bacterium]